MRTDQECQAGEMRLHCGGHRADKKRLIHNTGSEARVIISFFAFANLTRRTKPGDGHRVGLSM